MLYEIHEEPMEQSRNIPRFNFDPVLKVLYTSVNDLARYIRESICFEDLPKGYLEKPKNENGTRRFAVKPIRGLSPLQANLIEFNLVGVRRI